MAAETKSWQIQGIKPKAITTVASVQQMFDEEMNVCRETILIYLPKFSHPCTLEEIDDLARLAVGKEAGHVIK